MKEALKDAQLYIDGVLPESGVTYEYVDKERVEIIITLDYDEHFNSNLTCAVNMTGK